MRIAIATESACDLPKDVAEKYDVRVIPFTIYLDQKEIKDGDVTNEDVFKFVAETGILPKTTALNEFEYGEWFDGLLKEYDAVVHFTLSGGFTSTYSHAVAAAKNRENVFVVDSEALSLSIGGLAIYARVLADEGKTPEEIVNLCEARKKFLQTSFIVERLDYLYKGGRCSGFQLLGANLMKLRPRIVLKDGIMHSDKKYRGDMKFAVRNYCRECLEEFPNIDKSLAFIAYASATEEMKEEARTALKNAGVKTIIETLAGCTIASHCGEHTLGIMYFNDGQETLK